MYGVHYQDPLSVDAVLEANRLVRHCASSAYPSLAALCDWDGR